MSARFAIRYLRKSISLTVSGPSGIVFSVGVSDDRVPGTEEAQESLYVCVVPGCGRKLKRKFIPSCPVHKVEMRLFTPRAP
jgi:hypothetical protein